MTEHRGTTSVNRVSLLLLLAGTGEALVVPAGKVDNAAERISQ